MPEIAYVPHNISQVKAYINFQTSTFLFSDTIFLVWWLCKVHSRSNVVVPVQLKGLHRRGIPFLETFLHIPTCFILLVPLYGLRVHVCMPHRVCMFVWVCFSQFLCLSGVWVVMWWVSREVEVVQVDIRFPNQSHSLTIVCIWLGGGWLQYILTMEGYIVKKALKEGEKEPKFYYYHSLVVQAARQQPQNNMRSLTLLTIWAVLSVSLSMNGKLGKHIVLFHHNFWLWQCILKEIN